ncbi:MAG: tryptophan synthase subunit alpha [Bernardetiaceae bacterium]|nr:tryptophan synthase subunit alpha [Bernardetiaceae bacterium]
MMRIQKTFEKGNVLTIYFTAGYPKLEDTMPILIALQEAGTDIVEIGMPFSDPIADGETIQESSKIALENGMHIEKLFTQLKNMRPQIHIPVFLMGYLNPVMQFGIENFLAQAQACGVDGLILPDLPLDIYEQDFRELFEKYNMANVFLISPLTSEQRIKKADSLSSGFLYVLSDSATTGKTSDQSFSKKQVEYFERVRALNLKNPLQIGFGISQRKDFEAALQYAEGAIIGSAFIRHIAKSQNLSVDIQTFVQKIKQTVLS